MKPQLNDLASVIAFEGKRSLRHQRPVRRKEYLRIAVGAFALAAALVVVFVLVNS